ncbi:MAG: fumarylacetoacetate hydrolase family protein [Acidimicrobiales bacterium]
MRLTAFADGSQAQMAVLGESGRLAPLATVDDFYADVERWSAKARELTDLPLRLSEIIQVPAVPVAAKVLCVGLNYRAHAAEGGRDVPSHPNVFARWPSTLAADGETVPLPAGEPRLDFEAELVAVVGSALRGVDERAAVGGILGYACGNDITARGYQHRTGQWGLGKNADRSAPMGPIVTADEVGDVGWQAITCHLNGAEMQRSTLDHMIFGPGEIIAYASGCLTLAPGDVVFAGTPAGVGFRRTPPVLMEAGDVVEVTIEGIGTLTNRIVAAAGGPGTEPAR